MSEYTVTEMSEEETCCPVCRGVKLFPEVQMDANEEVVFINTTDLCPSCRTYFLLPEGTEDCRRHWITEKINNYFMSD